MNRKENLREKEEEKRTFFFSIATTYIISLIELIFLRTGNADNNYTVIPSRWSYQQVTDVSAQWCSVAGVTGGWGGGGHRGRVPLRLLTRKFVLNYREKRGEEKRENGVKIEKENCKREGGKLKMEG